VQQCGIILTDDGEIGASPDGLVGDDGILEMKCPSPKVHVGYMRTGSVEKDYLSQLQGLLYVSGRKWVDVQSYCPAYPTVIIRTERDEKYIALLEKALAEFRDTLRAAKRDILVRFPTIERKTDEEYEAEAKKASIEAFDQFIGELYT
jgi:exodeoxyribonuclease (lambda-induced)